MILNILVKRSGALGDVLSATPVITRLRKLYPNARIVVHTAYPDIFKHNFAVNEINTLHEWDLNIDLDGAHETRRALNAVDAYMEVAFGDHGNCITDKSVVLNYSKIETTEPFVAIHPNKSWDNRTMPNYWWDEVVSGIRTAGYQIAVLGTNIDYCPQGEVLDLRSRLNLEEQAAHIGAAKVFICGASGLMILAAATSTPVIVPLTINSAQSALPWRSGGQGLGYFVLEAQVPCFGCSALATPGATFVGCESSLKDSDLGDYACIKTIKAQDAIQLAIKVME